MGWGLMTSLFAMHLSDPALAPGEMPRRIGIQFTQRGDWRPRDVKFHDDSCILTSVM